MAIDETSVEPASDETRIIPIAKIRRPKTARKIKVDRVTEMADSIREFGLLQPIGVTPALDVAGEYDIVFGVHRLAAHVYIGEDQIAARVFDFDAETSAIVTQVENAHRHELSQEDRYSAAEAFVRWYKAKHPEAIKWGGDRTSAKTTGPVDEPGEQDPPGGSCSETPPAEATSSPTPPPQGKAATQQKPKKSKSVVDAFAAKTGSKRTTASRDVAIVEKLDAEQRAALIARKVNHKQIAKIAGIKEEVDRKKVVNLIASGMPYETAIAYGTAPDNVSVEEVANAPAPSFIPEADMTDDEWFEHFCGESAQRLQYIAAYKVDALIYRHTRAARDVFRGSVKKPLAQAKVGLRGPLHGMLSRIVNICHPKDWPACGTCGGTGQAGSTGRCPKCNGNAFYVKTEAP